MFKLNKFFSSWPVCLDPRISNKEKWKAALHDPAYLILVFISGCSFYWIFKHL